MTQQRRKGTRTSSFGSPGRINHDSTPFYSSRLYEGLPKEEKVEYIENQIPREFLDKIFCKSSESMEELPDNSVHLVVTSPPYNVGKCYSEDTEVLTNNGWKFYYQLVKSDLIATVNPDNFELEYHPFDEIFVYDYEGKMLHFYKPRNSVDILVTPNHNVFCMPRTKSKNQHWQFLRASEAIKYNTLVFLGTVKWQGKEIHDIEIPYVSSQRHLNSKKKHANLKIDADTFLEFLGYFISEGHLASSQKGQHVIAITQRKGSKATQIRNNLSKLPFKIYEYSTKSNLIRFIITNKSLYTWLEKNVGSKASNKKIPEFVKWLDVRQLKIIFDALMLGDGNIVSESFYRYFSASEQLIQDMQEIALKLGYKCEIKKDKRHRKNCFRLEVKIPNNRKNACFPHIVPRKHVSTIDYKGKVWFISVKNHLFITRRNGCIAIQGNSYDQNLTLNEYRAFLKKVWGEVKRVLVPGGRACINIANLGRKPYIPLHAFIIEDMLELGFLMRGEIIWNKGSSSSPSTAWGSWCSAKNPTLRDVHEYILIFSKGTFSRESFGRKSTISKEEFLEFTKSVWTFPAESATKVGHPAPFPVELPYRLIQLYTFEGEVVLDPFMGSGQTAIAAIKAHRHYVGYEISEEYVKLAEKRVKEFSFKFNSPKLF